jgi:hypothetical protein
LVIWFTELLQIVTTSNYSVLANLRTRTIACTYALHSEVLRSCIRCRGSVITEPFRSNGRLFWLSADMSRYK